MRTDAKGYEIVAPMTEAEMTVWVDGATCTPRIWTAPDNPRITRSYPQKHVWSGWYVPERSPEGYTFCSRCGATD